jgi:serine/threonine-protein kinase
MPDFRYVHQPLADDSDGLPLLGNEDVVAALKRRIVHSAGGSFLITGFRGVGKTTVIARALAELQSGEAPVAVLPVTLNVARPKSVEQLLFEIIRRVFETLKDEDLLARMEPRVQRELLLAYARTSLSFNESRSNSSDRGAGLRLGLPAFLQGLTPQLELSRKSTDVLATQASFLAYTDADVEHDFLRIVSLVERDGRQERNGARPAWRGKIVVVIDELDKLTCDEEGRKCLDALLSGLKNLLTARGVHFLFVAGPDLHDAALRDRRRGNSVYESVFGWQLYVPCLWSSTDRLLDALLDVGPGDAERLAPLRDYLRFKSRGIPRLLLMELNSFVRWDEDGPWIEVAGPDRARVEFYAELEQLVAAYAHDRDTSRPFAVAIDEDRWLLGAYYLADWILQSEGATFTIDELIDGESENALDPLFALSPGKVEAFLEHLVRNGVLDRSGGRDPEATFYGDVPEAQKVLYRLTPTTRAKLADFARVNEDERAALAASDRAHQPWAESGVGGVVGNGRYALVEELDRDGLGRVYRARDRYGDGDVALKIFERSGSLDDDLMHGRFARKAAIARSLTHPHIVRTHDVFEEGAFLILVMDLVEGTSLERLLERVRPSPPEAVSIAVGLADALAYVWSRGIARLDLKPSRIFMRDVSDPVILDIGLAKHVGAEDGDAVDALTMANAILGTPRYAAPEQLRGEGADIRSDLYALGLILYEMLRGRRARAGTFSAVLGQAGGPVDTTELDVSPALRAVIDRMVAPGIEDRFGHPDEVRSALAATPEGGPARGSRG